MNRNKDTKYIDAFTASGSTGVLNVEQIREITRNVQQRVTKEEIVTVSMKGISSISREAAVALRTNIINKKGLANRVVIMGISPYVRQVIAHSIRTKREK